MSKLNRWERLIWLLAVIVTVVWLLVITDVIDTGPTVIEQRCEKLFKLFESEFKYDEKIIDMFSFGLCLDNERG